MTLEQLLERLYAANRTDAAVAARRAARWGELEKQISGLGTRLENQLAAEFGDEIAAACQERAEAQAAVDAELVRTAGDRSPFPLGTILVEWAQKTVVIGFGNRTKPDGPWTKTKRRAIVQVFSPGDDIPANQSRSPAAGDIVARLLGKDGKPGKKPYRQATWRGGGCPFAFLYGSNRYQQERWLPEGASGGGGAGRVGGKDAAAAAAVRAAWAAQDAALAPARVAARSGSGGDKYVHNR